MQYFVFIAECETHEKHIKVNDSRFYDMRLFEFIEDMGRNWRIDTESATQFARDIYFRFI